MFEMKYQRIRDLREDSDLTQKQTADILHMHKTQYVRYETGESELPLNIAILLAKHYNVSLDYLAGLSTDAKKYNKKI
jgi:transcriptional regulator with XRE-family HTH domain